MSSPMDPAAVVDLTTNITEIADALHLLALIHGEDFTQRWVDRITEGREQLASVLLELADEVFDEEAE